MNPWISALQALNAAMAAPALAMARKFDEWATEIESEAAVLLAKAADLRDHEWRCRDVALRARRTPSD